MIKWLKIRYGFYRKRARPAWKLGVGFAETHSRNEFQRNARDAIVRLGNQAKHIRIACTRGPAIVHGGIP